MKNENTKILFNTILPRVLENTTEHIDLSKKFYAKLISLGCFGIHTVQNIDCTEYKNDILSLLENNDL
jgi:hypothetical protein